MSPTTGVGHFGTKFGEGGAGRYKPKFNAIWESHGAVLHKRHRIDDIFYRLSTMHERDRRTDGTVTSKPIGDRIHQYRLNTCVGRFSVVCL